MDGSSPGSVTSLAADVFVSTGRIGSDRIGSDRAEVGRFNFDYK